MGEDAVRIRNFHYDGFGGQLREGYAPYTLTTLIRWTLDPGVGLFLCSDGKERLIPSFVLPKDYPDWVKPADAPAKYSPLFYVGTPSQS